MAASMSSSSSANKGHTAISTSTFYSVLKERPKRFVHANLLDVIDPNESDFSADEKKVMKKCLETAVMKEMPSKLSAATKVFMAARVATSLGWELLSCSSCVPAYRSATTT
ncbi:hypothetical protein MRX96_042681 [Rhipicephalus microplus]